MIDTHHSKGYTVQHNFLLRDRSKMKDESFSIEAKVWSYIHAFVFGKDLVEIAKEFQPLLCALRVHK